jgi:hypothetical protein
MANYFTDNMTFVPPGAGYHSVGTGTIPVDNGSPPSTYAIAGWLNGERGATVRVVGLTVLRAVFIVPGIWLSSKLLVPELKGWRIVAMGVAASTTITAGMLLYYWVQQTAASPSVEGTPGVPHG